PLLRCQPTPDSLGGAMAIRHYSPGAFVNTFTCVPARDGLLMPLRRCWGSGLDAALHIAFADVVLRGLVETLGHVETLGEFEVELPGHGLGVSLGHGL